MCGWLQDRSRKAKNLRKDAHTAEISYDPLVAHSALGGAELGWSLLLSESDRRLLLGSHQPPSASRRVTKAAWLVATITRTPTHPPVI